MAQENETEILLTINVGKAKEDLAALTKQIEGLNNASEDNEGEIRALESQWDKLNGTIKKAEEIQTPLSLRLKAVQRQLQVLKLNGQENTETYHKLIEKAGQLKDTMGDTTAANFTVGGTDWEGNTITWIGDKDCVSGGVYEFNIKNNYGLIKKMN